SGSRARGPTRRSAPTIDVGADLRVRPALSFSLRRRARARRLRGGASLIDDSVLHYDLDVRQRDDIKQWIAVDDDDVGELAGLDGAAIRQAEDAPRVDARRGHD